MTTGPVQSFHLDANYNLVLYYSRDRNLNFIIDNESTGDIILLNSGERLLAASFYSQRKPLFWTMGGVWQREFADYWDEAVLFAARLERRIDNDEEDEISFEAFYEEGYGDVIGSIRADEERRILMRRKELRRTDFLPTSLPIKFTFSSS